MKERKILALVSLMVIGIISGILWHMEVVYHGWPGLNWLSYFHWAIPVSVLLFSGWLFCFADIPSKLKRLGFALSAAAYAVIVYFFAGFFVAIAFIRGPQALFLLVRFGIFYPVMRCLIFVLPVFIVAGAYCITRIIIKGISIRKFVISMVIFYLAVPLSLLILLSFHGSIYGYLIQADMIHAIKTGIIVPFVMFALGFPYLKATIRITKQWAVLITAVVVIGIANYYLYRVYNNSYVKYTPVIATGDGLIEAPKLNTKEHKEKLGEILNDESVEWELRHSEIYIKKKWVQDKEMVFRYTNKANEAEYVKYVPVVLRDPDIGYEVVPELKIDRENLCLVLSDSGEKWQIINGELFITKKLALDKERVYNYTQQANGEELVKQLK